MIIMNNSSKHFKNILIGAEQENYDYMCDWMNGYITQAKKTPIERYQEGF